MKTSGRTSESWRTSGVSTFTREIPGREAGPETSTQRKGQYRLLLFCRSLLNLTGGHVVVGRPAKDMYSTGGFAEHHQMIIKNASRLQKKMKASATLAVPSRWRSVTRKTFR